MNRVRQLSAAGLLGIVMIFELAAFALLSLRDESFDYKALIFAGGLIVYYGYPNTPTGSYSS